MVKQLFIIALLCAQLVSFSQTREEKAAKNFEEFFVAFQNAYPADQTKKIFKNYSELWARKAIPEELKMMIEYSKDFYSEYLYHTKHTRDTLFKISDIDFTPNIKKTYLEFKQSIQEGEKLGKFNYKRDKEFSEKLKTVVDQIHLPIIGYYQSAIIITETPDGQRKENKTIITYNNDLIPVDFGIVE